MLTDLARKYSRFLLDPVAKWIGLTGISPSALTIVGFLLTFLVMLTIARGYLQLGGIFALVATSFDALDGALARATNQTSRFGAFLDSTLDRFAEAIIFLGIFIYFLNQDAQVELVLVYVTIVGSIMVSYTRARAEGIGVQMTEGLLTRLERLILLFFGLILGQITWVLWLLAILTNLTACQRMWLVWQKTSQEKA